MTVIAILLDGNNKRRYAGDVVNGHVHIETSERINMRGVRLETRGIASTSWQTGGKENSSEGGLEEYFNFKIYFLGSKNNHCQLYLEPGEHDFPFSFVIPPNVPQSFESFTGHVRYKVKAVIDRPMRRDDTAEIQLPVIRLLDLNKEPKCLRKPLSKDYQCNMADKTFWLWPIRGPLEMTVRVNKGCFAPGETIQVDGEVRNGSSGNVKHIDVSFLQKIVYHSIWDGRLSASTETVRKLATAKRSGLNRGQTDRFQNISFRVPLLHPSRLDGCKIIDITYYIELRAKFKRPGSYCATNCEVVIGNVPLKQVSQPAVGAAQPLGFPLPLPSDSDSGYMEPL